VCKPASPASQGVPEASRPPEDAAPPFTVVPVMVPMSCLPFIIRRPRGCSLDYGYAMTSHSSQGQTADRVLIHVDNEQTGEKLVNRRLAYVAISRARYDARVYTNDAVRLGEALSRDISKQTALNVESNQRFMQDQSFGAKRLTSPNHSEDERKGTGRGPVSGLR